MSYKTPEQQRAYARCWIAKRRADFFADKECVWCGSSEKLELDHVDPAQKVSHRIWSWSAPRREAEIAKCQVLCRDCHEEKGRQNGDLGHPGMAHGFARLADHDIQAIRLRMKQGDSSLDLSNEFGVSRRHIQRIGKGDAWRHLPVPV